MLQPPGGSGKPSAGPSASRYFVGVLNPERPPVFNRFVTCGSNCDGISYAQPSTSTPIVLMAVTRNVLLQTFRLVEHRRRLTISINSINRSVSHYVNSNNEYYPELIEWFSVKLGKEKSGKETSMDMAEYLEENEVQILIKSVPTL
jgi:hypothetical protein